MTLDGFKLPEQVPELGKAAPDLAVSGAASLPFSAEGEQAGLWCSGPNRPAEISIGGRLVARVLPQADHHPVNAVASPGFVRRESVGPTGTVMECWLVAPTLPLVALQWAGGRGTLLRIEALPGVRGLIDGAGGKLFVVQDGGEGRVVAFALVAGGKEWRVHPTERGATLEVVLDGPTTVLFAAGEASRVGAALSASAHLTAHEQRATRPPDDRLSVHSGIAAVDEAVGWAAGRIARSLDAWTEGQVVGSMAARPPGESDRPGSAAALFVTGLGALVLGDASTAERAARLLAMAPLTDPTDAWPAHPLAALLDARIALSTGRPASALRWVEPALAGTLFGPGAGHTDRGLDALTLESLADALRYAAPEDTISALRSRVAGRRSESGTGTPGRERRLPMAGAAHPTTHFLASAFQHGALQAPNTGSAGLDAVLRLWGGWPTTPDASWIDWRTRLTDGLTRGPAGPGSWDRHDPGRSRGASCAGALMAALVYGTLGYEADAPTGRIHLRPRLPSHVNALEVRGLMSGPDTVALTYGRTGDRHRFEVRAERARVPLSVVLEPSLPGAAVVGVRVDGEAVELDAVRHGDRIRPRVQLILDGVHTVEVDVGPA